MDFLKSLFTEVKSTIPQALQILTETPEQCFVVNIMGESLSIRAQKDFFSFVLMAKDSPMYDLHLDFYSKIKTLSSKILIAIIQSPLSVDEKGYNFIDIIFLIFDIENGASKTHEIPIGRFYLAGGINDPETRDFMRRLNQWTRKANTYLRSN